RPRAGKPDGPAPTLVPAPPRPIAAGTSRAWYRDASLRATVSQAPPRPVGGRYRGNTALRPRRRPGGPLEPVPSPRASTLPPSPCLGPVTDEARHHGVVGPAHDASWGRRY